MKKATDLGLKVIEYDDHILLTKGSDIKLDDPDPSKMRYAIEVSDLIASSTPVEGTPLLVIEDEVAVPEFELDLEKLRFIEGYKASQKSHPYSEEHLEKAMEYVYGIFMDSDIKSLKDRLKTFEEIKNKAIQYFNKKELYIETQPVKQSRFISTAMHKYEPKIENGQLKAVWR